jgi:hypothetical protein
VSRWSSPHAQLKAALVIAMLCIFSACQSSDPRFAGDYTWALVPFVDSVTVETFTNSAGPVSISPRAPAVKRLIKALDAERAGWSLEMPGAVLGPAPSTYVDVELHGRHGSTLSIQATADAWIIQARGSGAKIVRVKFKRSELIKDAVNEIIASVHVKASLTPG